jgi:hypothetical protein
LRAVTPVALGVFFTLSTLICAAVSATLLAPNTPLDAMWALKPAAHQDLLLLRPASTAGFIVLTLAMASAAWGCFGRKRWGRILALVIFALNGLGDAARALTGGLVEGLVGVAVAAVLLWWLTRPRVRALFDR